MLFVGFVASLVVWCLLFWFDWWVCLVGVVLFGLSVCMGWFVWVVGFVSLGFVVRLFVCLGMVFGGGVCCLVVLFMLFVIYV